MQFGVLVYLLCETNYEVAAIFIYQVIFLVKELHQILVLSLVIDE